MKKAITDTRLTITVYFGSVRGSVHLQLYQQDVKTKKFGTDVKSDLTVTSSQKHRIWNCSEQNLTMIPMP
jgi:hypothetical protein